MGVVFPSRTFKQPPAATYDGKRGPSFLLEMQPWVVRFPPQVLQEPKVPREGACRVATLEIMNGLLHITPSFWVLGPQGLLLAATSTSCVDMPAGCLPIPFTPRAASTRLSPVSLAVIRLEGFLLFSARYCRIHAISRESVWCR